jgi:glycosyltransferase involved in cell wall biosynthesis
MKKKLLILIDTMKPMKDGVSMFLENTLELLSKKYEITIIAPRFSDETYENARLITFPMYKLTGGDYGNPKVNRKVLKEEVRKCDIILSHESVSPFSSSFYALHYAKKFNKPFFTYIHSVDFELFTEVIKLPKMIKIIEKSLLQIYARWFLPRETATIISFPTIKKLLKNIKVGGKFETVPIGITDIFYPGESKYSFNDKVVIGYVGRLSREKGLDVLLETFLKLKKNNENIQLLIIGDGTMRNIFDNQTDVNVTGFIDHKETAEYYRAIDIFVLPSLTEANSLSTLEALKSGVCCVNSDVGAIHDYIKNGYNGFFYYTKEELIKILDKLIKDENLRKTIGKNASESVKKLTWENTVNLLIDVFEKYQS